MHSFAFFTSAAVQVLDLTIAGSFALIFLILLRFFWHKMPRKFIMPMWLLAGIRLMVPITIESPTSSIPADTVGMPQTVLLGLDTLNQTAIPDTEAAAAVATTLQTAEILGMVWFGGMVIMLLWGFVSYARLCRKCACATPLGEGVYECDSCRSPFVLGFFSPKIILPYGMEENQRQLVLGHERSHISRFDHIKKPIGWLVLAVHWFNPLVWAGFSRFCKDIERDCDERSVSDLDSDQRRAYSEALLQFSTDEKLFNHPIAFGELDTKWRIERVLSYRKPAKYMAAIAVLGIIVMIFCFMTNPKDSSNAASIGIIGGADGPTAIFVSGEGMGDMLDYKTYAEYAENYTAFPVISYAVSDPEDKLINGRELAAFLEKADWNSTLLLPKHDPVLTIDFGIGSYLHLYELGTGLAAIQSGDRFRYYNITKDEHIELRAMVYYPSKPPADDVTAPPDIPTTQPVGISREALLAMAGHAPAALNWEDFEGYDYYPQRAKDPISRAYFTYAPGFYLLVTGDENIHPDALLFYNPGGVDTAPTYEFFDISRYTADEIDTIIAEYPDYANWSFTMSDWETDEYTRHLPKPPVGTLVQAIKYYQTPNVQLTLEGSSPSDYFKQVQAAGFEQIAYNEFMIDSDPAAAPVINGLFTNGEWSVSMSASGGELTIAITEGEFKVWNQ